LFQPPMQPQESFPGDGYPVSCFACPATFDALAEKWCGCITAKRTIVCPGCGACFCKAPAGYKQRFWEKAPQAMWDRATSRRRSAVEVPPNPPVSSITRPLVLVVDDEPDLQRAALAALEELGYGGVVARDGMEGLELARRYRPDLVLADAFMPRLDGREMCLRLKNNPFTSKLKVVIMTGGLGPTKDDITKKTPASFEPTIDYVVTKIPKWQFEKFPGSDSTLGTQMKSVGEVMAIGRTFQESFQKALRGLEVGVDGFNLKTVDPDTIADELAYPRGERLWYVADAFGIGMSVDELHGYTKIDPWFLAQIKEIVDLELVLDKRTLDSIGGADLRELKRMGFSDRRLAYLFKTNEAVVRARRHALGSGDGGGPALV